MSVKLVCYVKAVIVFYKFYNFFCRLHSLMNRLCYNNLFKIMQYDNLLNLIKDTYREKAPSNKTPALTKSTNMGIWFVVTSNQLFIRGS